ncbi:MAG TPA: hypothetical protein VK634_16410 [Reyranella sp.]|nr:hypothetical protein [Reyranella sp.]HTE82267.1 hypothetical protein [Reyranella sp.]
MMMRIAAGVIALLALGTALPAAAQAPKIGQLEIRAYQAIPKTKTAVQLTSDSALGRNLRREVMIRIARRGNEVGFSGGNVMRMDVQYIDLLGDSGITRGPVGGRDQNFDGPAANPRPEVPGIRIERGGPAPMSGGPTLRITLTLYSTDGGKVLWTAAASCYTQASMVENAGTLMIDNIFSDADKNRIADAGCPL